MRYFADKKNKSVMKSQVRALTLNRISICLGLNLKVSGSICNVSNVLFVIEKKRILDFELLKQRILFFKLRSIVLTTEIISRP